MRQSTQIRTTVVASVALLALATLPSLAGAAAVSVTEAHFQGPYVEATRATLEFAAIPGERNQVTVSQVGGPDAQGFVALTAVDEGAPLQAGTGCTGGGAPGSVATCRIHAPKEADSRSGGKDLAEWVPDTEWSDHMVVRLGDGDDSFNGSSFTGEDFSQWHMEVEGGVGNDTIATGAGDDKITPGGGDDVVHAGNGLDIAIADPTPDGNDLLDLGEGDLNTVDNGARTEPLHLAAGVLGAAGEADTLEGRDMVVGGSGADEFLSRGEWLRGGGGDDKLVGSPGNDFIFGGPGDDRIYGAGGDDQLLGGEGDDTIGGGTGDDTIEEREEGDPTDPGAVADNAIGYGPLASGGDDFIAGGAGDDLIRAGREDDSVYGGPGNDRLHGEAGADEVVGEAGDDVVAGEAGADQLLGGKGDDVLRGGRTREGEGGQTQRAPVDTAVDKVDCGPGDDIAQANAWDRVTACEHRKVVRAVRLKVIHRLPDGETVRYNAAGHGRLTFSGPDVRPVRSTLKGRTHSGELVLHAIGSTLAELHRTDRATVTLKISLRPDAGPAASETRRLVLRSAP